MLAGTQDTASCSRDTKVAWRHSQKPHGLAGQGAENSKDTDVHLDRAADTQVHSHESEAEEARSNARAAIGAYTAEGPKPASRAGQDRYGQ